MVAKVNFWAPHIHANASFPTHVNAHTHAYHTQADFNITININHIQILVLNFSGQFVYA